MTTVSATDQAISIVSPIILRLDVRAGRLLQYDRQSAFTLAQITTPFTGEYRLTDGGPQAILRRAVQPRGVREAHALRPRGQRDLVTDGATD